MNLSRILLIVGFASLAFFGFFWQDKLLSGNEEKEYAYEPHMDVYMVNGKAEEIVMTRMEDKDHLLIKYRINFEDFKFESLTAITLKEPVLDVQFKPTTKEVWVQYSDGWKLYDENLEKVIDRVDLRTETPLYQMVIKEQEENFELSVSGENIDEWTSSFTKRPVDVGIADGQKDLWIILFDDYDVKIWSPSSGDM